MEAVREAALVALHDLAGALRSVKAWLLLGLFGVVTLLSGAAFVWSSARLADALESQYGDAPPEVMAERRAEAYEALIRGFVSDPDQAGWYLGIPAVVLFFFWIMRVGLPVLIAVVAYDQISGEAHGRTLRYTLLRCRRGAVVAGKLASNLILVVSLIGLTAALLLAFAVLAVPDFDVGAGAVHLLRTWALLMPLSAAYVAMTSWISAAVRPPMLSLLVVLSVLAILLVAGVVAWAWAPATFLGWLVPWHYNDLLTSHRVAEQLAGAGAYLVFAVVFAGLSWLTFSRQDL